MVLRAVLLYIILEKGGLVFLEWQVVTTLVVLVGLIVTIVTPMIKLNTSIVKLTDAVQNLQVFQDLNKDKLEEH